MSLPPHATQLKWQRRLRHGAPRSREPRSGGRTGLGVSAAAGHSGHFGSRGSPAYLQPDRHPVSQGAPVFTYSVFRPGVDTLGSAATPGLRCAAAPLPLPLPRYKLPLKPGKRPASSTAPTQRRSSSSHYPPHCYLAVTGNDCAQQEVTLRFQFTTPLPDY